MSSIEYSSDFLMPYSVEGFFSADDAEQVIKSIDSYKAKNPRTLQAGAKGITIHGGDPGMTVAERVALYEPAGRLDINWQDIPKDIIELVETRFYERIEDIRRAYPRTYGPYGFTYVEYNVGQYFSAHVDGIGTEQVAGFGITLTNDFDGGEFAVETCGSGRLWALDARDQLLVAPGHHSGSDWYRNLPRTRWTTRPVRGNALFYGSGLTHSSQPVTRGVLRKVLAFIRSY